MSSKNFTSPAKLERYSFLWSEARLLIAAFALFLGGVPPILKLTPYALYGFVNSILTLCWVISGIASAYLLLRWFGNKQVVFKGKEKNETYAFFVSVVSGLNLGIAGIFSKNIGMSITMNHFILFVVGILYLWAAWTLYRGWKGNEEKVFHHQ